uniref:Reverse transcriptase domain-containing protein n=1 Tax=Macrostomum lignano TaxID=282301 RepID=A0A1I8F4W8_9PLAT
MVHRLPVVDTKHWELRRPNGERLSVQAVQQLLRDPNYKVPNAVHYILPFSDPVIQFHHLVCILSGVWVLRPDFVIFWYSSEPKGQNWDLLKRKPHRVRSVPKSVYTQPVLIREHQSDVIRMEALLVFGGVYLDLDIDAALRNYSFTIGRELPQNLCNGSVLVSAELDTAGSVARGHVAYQSLDDSGWGSLARRKFPAEVEVRAEPKNTASDAPASSPWLSAGSPISRPSTSDLVRTCSAQRPALPDHQEQQPRRYAIALLSDTRVKGCRGDSTVRLPSAAAWRPARRKYSDIEHRALEAVAEQKSAGYAKSLPVCTRATRPSGRRGSTSQRLLQKPDKRQQAAVDDAAFRSITAAGTDLKSGSCGRRRRRRKKWRGAVNLAGRNMLPRNDSREAFGIVRRVRERSFVLALSSGKALGPTKLVPLRKSISGKALGPDEVPSSAVVASQVTGVMNACSLSVLDPYLPYEQNGFRPQRGTVTHILALRRAIEEPRIRQSTLIIVFVDFLKSFDSVLRAARLRAYRVPQQLIDAVMALYCDTRAAVITVRSLDAELQHKPEPPWIRHPSSNFHNSTIYSREELKNQSVNCKAFLYAQLDVDFLVEKFDLLKKIVKPLARKYTAKVDQLMVHRLPVVDTKHWELHRPNGERLSVQAVQQLLRDPNYKVPNAVHYILPFSDPVIQFHHLVCILSGVWVLRPDFVIFWYSSEPKGQNWNLLKRNLTESGVWFTKVLLAHRSVPKSVYTQPVLIREHQSDVIRMEALLVFGGVYSDLDVISLRSMQPLRNYSFTIGRELPQNLCNGVFLSAPNSTLLALWHVAYQSLDDSGWGEHSLMLPNRLCHAFPEHCHVEQDSMDRPNFLPKEIVLIYGKQRGWDWRKKNYAMHLWYRMHKRKYSMESIKHVDSMLGDMFRFVLRECYKYFD